MDTHHGRCNRLARDLNFRVEQHNSCRTFGPERSLTSLSEPPALTHEVYVTRLPRNLYEDELYTHFVGAGAIYKIRMFVQHSGVSKGYAYVKFKESDSVKKALDLNRSEIRPGWKIVVVNSVENKTLVLDLSAANQLLISPMKESDVTQIIANIMCMEGLKGIFKVYSVKPDGVFHLDFVQHRDAVLVMKALDSTLRQRWGSVATIRWFYNPEREQRKKEMYGMQRYTRPVQGWQNHYSGGYRNNLARMNFSHHNSTVNKYSPEPLGFNTLNFGSETSLNLPSLPTQFNAATINNGASGLFNQQDQTLGLESAFSSLSLSASNASGSCIPKYDLLTSGKGFLEEVSTTPMNQKDFSDSYESSIWPPSSEESMWPPFSEESMWPPSSGVSSGNATASVNSSINPLATASSSNCQSYFLGDINSFPAGSPRKFG